MKEKVINEKFTREIQLKDDKTRKRQEEKKQKKDEENQVHKLKNEMEQERVLNIEKRRQEKEYLLKMLNENDDLKKN